MGHQGATERRKGCLGILSLNHEEVSRRMQTEGHSATQLVGTLQNIHVIKEKSKGGIVGLD